MGQVIPLLRRENVSNFPLDFHGISLRRPPESAYEATEVRVHCQPRDIKCIAQHHIGGFSPDPRKDDKFLKGGWHFPTVMLTELLCHGNDACRLVAEETS